MSLRKSQREEQNCRVPSSVEITVVQEDRAPERTELHSRDQ